MERYKKLSDYRRPVAKGQVGSEVESWCTKCRQMIDHTVLAATRGQPARVMCTSCKGQHGYKPNPPGTTTRKTAGGPRARTKTTKSPRPSRPAQDWEHAKAGKSLSQPIAYNPQRSFAAEEVVLHGKFGIGIVSEVKPGGKMMVVFEDATRVLVHDRAEAST